MGGSLCSIRSSITSMKINIVLIVVCLFLSLQSNARGKSKYFLIETKGKGNTEDYHGDYHGDYRHGGDHGDDYGPVSDPDLGLKNGGKGDDYCTGVGRTMGR